MSLHDRKAVVTGGSRSLGRAICLELARRGADVVVNYSGSAEQAEEVAEEIRGLGRRALAVQADVADADAVQRLADTAREELGGIDLWVNNAGILRRAFLMMMKPEEFSHVLQVNLAGAFHGIKSASRAMIKARTGSIVNVSSLAGMRGLVGQGAYSASKGGMNSLTIVAAKELARYGVRVNGVAPGSIATGMMLDFDEAARSEYLKTIPLAREGEAEEVARVVAFLASDDASYVTGQTISVDGGMSIG